MENVDFQFWDNKYYLFINLFIYLSIYIAIYLLTHSFIHSFVYLFVCLSISRHFSIIWLSKPTVTTGVEFKLMSLSSVATTAFNLLILAIHLVLAFLLLSFSH